jgi:hypothetical protein
MPLNMCCYEGTAQVMPCVARDRNYLYNQRRLRGRAAKKAVLSTGAL